MRQQSNDPDVRRYDRQDEMIACPECKTWMLPLADYEIQKASESPTVGAEGYEIFLWGLWAYVYNFIYDSFLYEGRKKKLAQQKKEVLPRFPHSWVCPRCLHILKRS